MFTGTAVAVSTCTYFEVEGAVDSVLFGTAGYVSEVDIQRGIEGKEETYKILARCDAILTQL